MLNRRTLRIKVMQMLFAYKQRVHANYELAEEFIREVYAPDLNSMEVQDPVFISANRKIAMDLFYLHLKENAFLPKQGDRIEETVSDAISTYYSNNKKDAEQLLMQLIKDVDHLYIHYISFLELIIELQFQAEKDQKRDHRNFVKNLLIQGLKLNKTLEKAILANGSGWKGKAEVKEWMKNLVTNDPVYIEYSEKGEVTFEDDFEILKHLVNKILFKHKLIETYLEESDLFWDENRPVVKSLLLKTLKSIEEREEENFDLQEISYNFEEDKEFFVSLYKMSLEIPEELTSMIAEKAVNWDIDRLALTDRVILEMAITELTKFPSIPVKVTINEYIEVSKKYSTPKSKQFINGMLDVIADQLKETGVIRKSGRGLMDNK